MNLTNFQHAKSNPRLGLKLDNADFFRRQFRCPVEFIAVPSAVSPYVFANCCSVGRSVIPSFEFNSNLLDTKFEFKIMTNLTYLLLQAGNKTVP